jgi:hypothetical protein
MLYPHPCIGFAARTPGRGWRPSTILQTRLWPLVWGRHRLRAPSLNQVQALMPAKMLRARSICNCQLSCGESDAGAPVRLPASGSAARGRTCRNHLEIGRHTAAQSLVIGQLAAPGSAA